MTQANNIAVTLGWLAGSYKIANTEEVIVKSLRAQVKGLPKEGVLDLWYDMTNRKAKLNAGDWCSGAEIDAWKTTLIKHEAVDTEADIEVMDEAGGPGDGDWVKIASAAGTDIRDSAINGKGLFATRSFTTGDTLVTDFMQKQHTEDPRTRWEQSDACRYTNHSDKPNAFIRKLGETVELIADETIQPNEEITCNYRDAAKTLGKAFFYTYRGKPYGTEPSDAAFMQKTATTKPDTFYGLPTFLKQAQTTDDILDRIANARSQTATEVSAGNAAAGNYRKGRFNYHGLRISIENPKGSTRSGVAADGTKWSTEMKFDYGYIRGTIGADGDPVDVFIGDDPKSELVFIVNQVNKSGNFDEHKVVLGVVDAKQARQTYLANYKPGWTGAGSVVGMTMQQFKAWLQTDGVNKPAVPVEHSKAANAFKAIGKLLQPAAKAVRQTPVPKVVPKVVPRAQPAVAQAPKQLPKAIPNTARPSAPVVPPTLGQRVGTAARAVRKPVLALTASTAVGAGGGLALQHITAPRPTPAEAAPHASLADVTKRPPATPGESSKSLADVLPVGYREDAQRHAKAYRDSTEGAFDEPNYWRQNITDAAIDRQIPYRSLSDAEFAAELKKTNPAGGPSIDTAAYYMRPTAEMNYKDSITAPASAGGKYDSHELTHASQTYYPQSSRESVVRPAYTPAVTQLLNNTLQDGKDHTDTARYLTNPIEEEAYLAAMKRNYFKATGKHVTNPSEAAQAIEWSQRNPQSHGGLLDELLHIWQQAKPGTPAYDALQHWILGLTDRMPGLVQSNMTTTGMKQAENRIAVAPCDNAVQAIINMADTAAWRQVPKQVATLMKSASDIKKQVQKAMETLSVADPGYGYVYWHPKRNNLWVVLSDSDEQDTYDAWWKALSKIPGINKVITEAEVGPHGDHKDEWIQIKKARVFTKNSTINPFTLAGKPFGGPNAVTNSVVGALIGGGLGYGGGRLAEMLLPERHFERGRLSKNLAMAGAALGAAPGLVQGGTHMGMNSAAGDPSVYRSWLQPTNAQKVAPNSTSWRKHVLGKMAGADPSPTHAAILRRSAKCAMTTMSGFGNTEMRPINVDAFNNVIWHDPYSPPAVNAAAAGIVSGIQQHYGGASVLTPRHFIKGLAAAGVDAATATVAGGVLGVLGGLKPESQQTLQQMGLWSGLMRGSIGSIFGQ